MATAVRSGYVALLSVLIVSVIAATTVLILFITSINSTLSSGDIAQSKIAKSLAEGCAEMALQCLTNGSSDPIDDCPSGITDTPRGMCKINEIYNYNGSGTGWRIRTTGSGAMNTVVSLIEVDANRPVAGSASSILNWRECLNFDDFPCDTP